jgi:hypothetical protein
MCTRIGRKIITSAGVIFIGVSAVACTSQPAIVADPPQHTHSLPEEVPWEEEYTRTRPNPEVFEEEVAKVEKQEFNGNLEQEPEKESSVLQVVTDVIAFPFRGVGWILQQLF